MTERERVAGLLSGRLTPADVAHLGPTSDLTLKRIKWAAETLLLAGKLPKNYRVLVGFDVMGWPIDGIPELLDALRREG